MKNMTLENIAHSTGGQLFLPEGFEIQDKEVQGVVIDNRQIEKDYLFVAMKGERVDGHKFIPDAFEKGAMAAISEQEIENAKGPYILVKDTAQALKDLAEFYREQLSTVIIGIVGSVGKTSTKEMVASVLSQKYNVLKTQGNFNNEIGLPLTLCRIRDEHEVAVVEMGISDFGEMNRLGKMAKPDMVVMTNIGLCHLENLGTRDGILKAKTEVFDHLANQATIILNGDDDKLQIADTKGYETHFFGCNEQEFSARDSQGDLTGVTTTIHTSEWEETVRIAIAGEHNVYNALAATVVATKLDLTKDEIVAGIQNAGTIDGRNNFIEKNGIVVIDDCYNANPVSMKASLEVLSHAKGRKIAVLGDMGELGADEKKLHYSVGETVVVGHIDILYTAGELAKEIARAVQEQSDEVMVCSFDAKEELIEALQKEMKEGDTILVKASHFMNFTEVVKRIVE